MESKKSLLEKLGLIEKIENKSEVIYNSDEDSNADLPDKNDENIDDDIQKPVEEKKPSQMDQLLKPEEIYKKFNLNNGGTNTIFIIDNFTKALPDYLPIEIKRQSVLNIISSSGMDIMQLLKDGNERLEVLKKFHENFSISTDKIISDHEKEIDRLIETINKYKKVISERKKLSDEQKAVIECETQKIQSIIQFINDKQ